MGNIQSDKIYQCYTIECNKSSVRSIVQDDQGYIYTLSDYWDNLNMDVYVEYNARIQKLDPEFNVVWDYILRPPEIQVEEMIMSEDGYLLVTGTQTAETFFSNKLNAYVAKIDLDGTLVDIEEINESPKSTVSIYPNPTMGQINITTTSGGILQLLNIKGQVLDGMMLGKDGKGTMTISNPGVYFMQLKDETGQVINVEKVIVMK